MNNWLLAFILYGTVYISCNSIVHASDSESMIVVTEEWAPYNYKQADGKITGSSTLVVEQTLRNSNIPYYINIYPWARSYGLALNNANVLLYSTVRTPAREKLFHWVCPINSVEYSIFKLTSRKDIIINSLDDLENYSTGITRETFLHSFLDKHGLEKGVHFTATADNEASFLNLLKERIDLFIDTQEHIDEQLVKHGLEPDSIMPVYNLYDDPDGRKELCMAISLKTPVVLVKKIRAEHQKLIKKSKK